VPTGTPTIWAVPNIDKANALFHIFDPTAFPTVRATGAPPCNAAPGCGAFQLGPQPALGSNGTVREDDTAGWLMAQWDTTIAGMSFRGNAGARFVVTGQTATGFSYDSVAKAVVPTTVHQNYHDFLPSLNAVLEPVEDFLVRFNASQVITRPNLTDLLPGATVSKSGNNLTVKIGNPFLKPFRARSLDLSFEWYYQKGGLLSVAGFYKHIDDFTTSLNESIPYSGNPFGLPDSLALAACGGVFTPACNPTIPWLFTTPVNQKGSPLYGVEINWQQPFDFLPDPFSNFGILANVTYVQAQQTYFNSNGTIQAIADLQNLSRRSANGTIYYDDGTFQARISASYRSKYLPQGTGIAPGNLNDVTVNGGTFNLDASSTYKFDENFSVLFQALNLTNQFQYQYVDSVGHRLFYNHQTGREFFLGLSYNY
jgi:TonB-dependent receptor